ncbi:MAG: phosphate acetyltransferase [Propionibacteriaceae bacterium]|nr:phosphate acetyltransferase [Propionibacteriaceae bacterium]
MTTSVYVLAPEALLSKSAIALGSIEAFTQSGLKVGVFRPIIRTDVYDTALETLLESTGVNQEYEQAYGVTYAEIRENTEAALTKIIAKYQTLKANFDAIVILGSDYADVIEPIEFQLNAKIAANLNSPVILVISGRAKAPSDLRYAVDFCLSEIEEEGISPFGVVAIGLDSDYLPDYDTALSTLSTPVVITVPGVVASQVKMPTGFTILVDTTKTRVRTPLAFQYELMQKAGSEMRTIVLPEGLEDRILISADIVLSRGIANLIILGKADEILARAEELGLDLSKAKIQDPKDPSMLDSFAAEYTKLRQHKGMTLDKAHETLTNASYFATMMIHMGLADGMVSGAVNTTADTIRPSLEFIKTKPGVASVSGYFLMCLPNQVLVFADCAVTPNPTAENLAEIAAASAETAASFGIEPRVAMLSYSTGTSGSGPDVDLVAEATHLLRTRSPELLVEGPIQFDAAIDPVVAKTKLPDSPVAGQATVFIFPDLNTGNTTYKAVQRTAKAIAIGPVLQGLNKPVNDLSRGALVEDIVNTIAITAIQAQAVPGVSF